MLAAAGSAPGQQRRDFGGARPQPRAASPAGSRSLPPAAAAAMATRSCREKAQKQNEQHQAILAKLLREEDNKYCADCEAKGTGGRGAGGGSGGAWGGGGGGLALFRSSARPRCRGGGRTLPLAGAP